MRNRESGNLFDELPGSLPPGPLPEELIETLATGGSVRIERIVSHGHASKPDFWYDQAEHEWVIVLAGWAHLLIEGEAEGEASVRLLRPGDFVLLPAHRRHRVEATDPNAPTVWLAVFFA